MGSPTGAFLRLGLQRAAHHAIADHSEITAQPGWDVRRYRRAILRHSGRVLDAMSEPSLSFGIEEEYHLVDLKTRDLADAPKALMKELEGRFGSQVSPEFLKSQIEIGTKPVHSFADARAELQRLRAGIAEAAAAYGLAPIAAGSHPFALPDATEMTDKRRYRELDRDFAGAIRGLSVCGMHVHAGIEDDDLRIDLMNQARYFLPHLLALSTSSPFWRGVDTGLKSYRKGVLRRLPRSGVPGLFGSWEEYQRTIAVLANAGIAADGTKFWWDLRPSARFPTLEVRVADVCPLMEDALSIAALYLCFLRMLVRYRRSNLKWRTYPISLIEENMWRAQRYGITGELLDLSKGKLVALICPVMNCNSDCRRKSNSALALAELESVAR